MRKLFSNPKLLLVCAALCVGLAVHAGLVSPELAFGVAFIGNVVPFAENPQLTAIAIGYANTEDTLIADQVMPRVPTAKKFKWTEYDSAQAYTVPDTEVGRRSEPSEVTFEGTDHEDRCKDYAIDNPVPQSDIEEFDAMPKPPSGGPIDPRQLATMNNSNLLILAREIRVAAAAQLSTNYDAANRTTLVGSDQWSDPDSDPLKALLNALDTPLIRPNTLVLNQQVWTALRQHKVIVQATKGTAQESGSATKQAVADLLEIKQVLVGSSRVNTARKGQAASFSRVWGKHASLLYISQAQAQMNQPVWGWTASFGQRFAGEIVEQKKGIKGTVTVRVGEQVKEVVAAKGAGYFFQNAIA